ncbi:hypothetical protein PC129_g20884 [Phytophthora cactorum]|uniref:Uncharacterized protein n=1 Tax=Phytophthora cactorum TaxID=29920 RepID=A0A8T1B3X0_9STRA|nr:hypothetical protein Pcac1_g5271 [Phytophthora cactorum]KAG2797696.1 hypothetical protein PC111_g21173 [Phytophthora cactorum]KAG2797804.1 hypothetical protein PC112_g21627 [Phytophthora cactorum]KAG2827855.1 hypothetical protein PC113_g21554 [Phytophthora cactorum]KAG2876929.1 hypothetical protein PC114_g23920 [Phytophthora cactorum]
MAIFASERTESAWYPRAAIDLARQHPEGRYLRSAWDLRAQLSDDERNDTCMERSEGIVASEVKVTSGNGQQASELFGLTSKSAE